MQGLEVHQLGAARIGDIGDVRSAIRTTRQVPNEPSIHVAEERIAALCGLAQPIDLIEQPADLGSRKIRRQWQAGLRPKPVLAPFLGKLTANLVRPHVLPHDGWMERLAGLLIPYHSGLALVRDPHRGHGLRRCPRLL